MHFCADQWKFLSPIFDTNGSSYNFETSSYVLPFTKKLDKLGQRTFGQVTRFEIHPAHLVYPSEMTSLVNLEKERRECLSGPFEC